MTGERNAAYTLHRRGISGNAPWQLLKGRRQRDGKCTETDRGKKDEMQEENGVKVSWLTRGQTSVSANKKDAGWTLYLFIGQVMGWQDEGLSGMDQGPGMSTHKHASSHRQQRDTRTHVHGHRRARAHKVSFPPVARLSWNKCVVCTYKKDGKTCKFLYINLWNQLRNSWCCRKVSFTEKKTTSKSFKWDRKKNSN